MESICVGLSVQRYQNTVLKNIVNAAWQARKSDLHRAVRVEMVADGIKKFAQKHEAWLCNYVNTIPAVWPT